MLRIKTNNKGEAQNYYSNLSYRTTYSVCFHSSFIRTGAASRLYVSSRERERKNVNQTFPLSTQEPQEPLSLPWSIEKKNARNHYFSHPRPTICVMQGHQRDPAIIVEQTRMRDYDKSTIESTRGDLLHRWREFDSDWRLGSVQGCVRRPIQIGSR